MNTAKIACNLSEDIAQIAETACGSPKVKAYVAGIFARIKSGVMPGFQWDDDGLLQSCEYTAEEAAELVLEGVKDRAEEENVFLKTVDDLACGIMVNIASLSGFNIIDKDGVNAGLYDLVCEEAGLDPREVAERENMYGEF